MPPRSLSTPSAQPGVCLQDIAQQTGLSRSGVSRALRNDPSIPLATCRRVQGIARKLGFVHDRNVARAFQLVRRSSSPQVEGVLGWIDMFPPAARWRAQAGLYVTRIFAGAQARAAELGYKLEVFSLLEKGMSPRRVQSILDARGVIGLLIPPLPEDVHLLPIKWEKYTAVALTHSLQSPGLHRVLPHQYHVATLALNHLLGAGYRRIGFVTWSELDVRVNHLFRAAYLSYQYEVPPSDRLPILMTQGPVNQEAFHAWFELHRPDALLTCEPRVIQFLTDQHASKIKQVGVASIGGNFNCPGHPMHRQVAYVDQNISKVGSAGVDQIIAQLERRERGVPTVASVLMIEGTWMPGLTLPEITR